MSHTRETDEQDQNSSTSGGWLHSMVESLTPSVFTGLWPARQQRPPSSPTSRSSSRRNGFPSSRRDIEEDRSIDNRAASNQQYEAQADPDSGDRPRNNMTATSAVSHGAPIPLQQLGELVSRYERPARPKRTEEPAFVDANSNDRETASQYSSISSFSSDHMPTNRIRKRPGDTSELDDQESSNRNASSNDFKRFRYGMEPLARPSVASSANAYANDSSHSMFLDRSQTDQSGRLSRSTYDRPSSSMSSASTTLRARISSIGSTGGPGSSALSSRTRRILEELEKMSTPVKDAQKLPTLRPWLPERWDRTANQIEAHPATATLRGPPLASLSTPTRAQLLSRTIGSNSSKPYWRRPSMSAPRAAPSAVKTSPTSAGGIVKGADGAKINKFSARIPELEEPDSTPHFNSVPLPIATSQVPAAGFLAGSSKFSFAKPVPKSGPVVSPAETPGVSSVMAVKNKWTCSACFVGNDADAEKCACCSGPRAAAPKSEASSTSAPIAATNFSTSSSDTNSIDLPKKAWNCSTCFVSNDGSADQCVACSESRPGAPKSEKSKTLFPGSIFQSSSSSSSASPFADSAAAAPKKGWSCSNCFVKNEDSTDNCVACMGARPGAPKVDGPKALFANSLSSTSAPSTENKTTSAKKGWTCSTCFVGNDDSTDNCVACSESRPGAPKSDKNKPLFAGSIFSTSSSAAGSEASIPKKDWSCTTCFVSNKADKLSCDACQSPKPGSTFKPVSFGFGVASKPAAAVIPSGVSFGVVPHNESFGEKKTVKFAEPLTTTTTFSSAQSPLSLADDGASSVPANSSSSDTLTNNATTLSTPTTTAAATAGSGGSAPFVFGFGGSKETSTTSASTAGSGSSTTASAAPPVFAFGASAATTATTTSAPSAPSSTSTFVFGSSSSAAPTSSAAASSSLTSVATSTTTSDTTTTTAVSTSSESSLTSSAPVFAFGSTASAPPSTTSSSTSLFPSSATSGFSFGSKAAAPASSTSGSFLASGPAAPSFGFGGAPAATTTSTGALFPPAAPLFSFGGSATTTTAASSATSNGPLFSTAAAPASFNFGAAASTAVPSTTAGSSFSTAAPPAFNFGGTAASAAVPSTTAGSSFSAAAAAPSFNFGAAASAAAPSTTTASSFSAAAAAPAFNFGATPSTTSSLFPSASVPSMFSFAGGGAAPATTTVASATPASGSASIFAFGSRPTSETTDSGARNAFNLPSTFRFGEPSGSTTGQPTDTSSSIFQFQSAAAAPPNPFLPSTAASAKQSSTRKMLTAHRRKRQ